MSLTNEMKQHYEAVLQDLEAQRLDVHLKVGILQKKLNDLCHSISTITSLLPTDNPSSSPSRPSSQRFAELSAHWAILDLLNDSQPLSTAEIAEALLSGGFRTKAANFANNVSAVLGTTMRDRSYEVVQLPDGRWQLSPSGKEKIDYIRTTPRFRQRRRSFARF